MAERKMSINSRFEYLQAMQERYRVAADRKAKSALLDEMESLTHLGRKHLIALMNSPDLRRRKRDRERQRIYDAEVAAAVKIVADSLDWICPERLQPTLRRTTEHLIADGEMEASPAVLDKLERISVATLGRVLRRVRSTTPDRLPRAYPGRRAETSAQQAVPISVIPWDEPEPGHFEVDLVHHGVPDADGKLVCTMQFVDVLTGWSERFAIMGFAFDAVWDAIQAFRHHCPIPARELHSDNGSEFINSALIACFGQELLDTAQTRGRPGYHNDNRFVEQKNCSLVRAYLGSLPLHTPPQRRALAQLYEQMWLYYNFFQPVLRQIERTAVTGPDGITRIRRKQDRARTPLERLLEAKPTISRETKEQLLALYDRTNPLALKRSIHAQIRALESMVTESRKEEAVTLV
jgi:hypothetical protein